jgi:hypothetical protein
MSKIATFSVIPIAKPIQAAEQDFGSCVQTAALKFEPRLCCTHCVILLPIIAEALLKQANQWEIDSKDLVMGDVIGKGYFGEVRRATWKGVEVAVKYMYRALAHDKDRLMFHKEILILRYVNSPSQLSSPNLWFRI